MSETQLKTKKQAIEGSASLRRQSVEPEPMPAAKKKERYRDIGQELRRMFDDVVSEPIPEDLLALMKKLEEQSGGGSEPKS